MQKHQGFSETHHQTPWYHSCPNSREVRLGDYGGDPYGGINRGYATLYGRNPYGYCNTGYTYQPSAFSNFQSKCYTSDAYSKNTTYAFHQQQLVNDSIYNPGRELGGDVYRLSPSSSEGNWKQREDVYDTPCEEIMSPPAEGEGKSELELLLKFSSLAKTSSPVYEHNMFDKMPIDEVVCEKNVLEEVCKENDELKMKLDAQIEESNGLRAKLVESEIREKEIEVDAAKLRDVYNALVEKFKDRVGMLQSMVTQKGLVEKRLLESNKVILELQGQIDGIVREKEGIEVERKEEVKKSSELQYTVTALNGRVLNLQREEAKLREDLVEFEKKYLEGLQNEAKMEKKITELVNGNNEKESIVDSLIEEKCFIQKELHKAVKQLDEEKKKTERTITEENALVEANVRRETELVELQKHCIEVRNAFSELEVSCKGQELKVKMLESEVGHYKAAYEQVALEKDEILRYFADEKQNGINMKKQIEEMDKHIQGIIKEIEGTKVDYLDVDRLEENESSVERGDCKVKLVDFLNYLQGPRPPNFSFFSSMFLKAAYLDFKRLKEKVGQLVADVAKGDNETPIRKGAKCVISHEGYDISGAEDARNLIATCVGRKPINLHVEQDAELWNQPSGLTLLNEDFRENKVAALMDKSLENAFQVENYYHEYQPLVTFRKLFESISCDLEPELTIDWFVVVLIVSSSLGIKYLLSRLIDQCTLVQAGEMVIQGVGKHLKAKLLNQLADIVDPLSHEQLRLVGCCQLEGILKWLIHQSVLMDVKKKDTKLSGIIDDDNEKEKKKKFKQQIEQTKVVFCNLATGGLVDTVKEDFYDSKSGHAYILGPSHILVIVYQTICVCALIGDLVARILYEHDLAAARLQKPEADRVEELYSGVKQATPLNFETSSKSRGKQDHQAKKYFCRRLFVLLNYQDRWLFLKVRKKKIKLADFMVLRVLNACKGLVVMALGICRCCGSTFCHLFFLEDKEVFKRGELIRFKIEHVGVSSGTYPIGLRGCTVYLARAFG